MADNYLQPVNNHFDLEDVDDDTFLNNSRGHSRNSGAVGGRSTNPFEEQQQTYAEKRRQIENRTLDSTQKSLGLLYETEEVGNATAVELAKQREQLERTSRQLDEINSTLRFSQRHLNGLKSVFGGLKNYLSGNRDGQSPRMATSVSGSNIAQAAAASGGTNMNTPSNYDFNDSESLRSTQKSPTERYNSHPITRLRGDSSMQQDQLQQNRNPFQTQLESNLDEMCDNLSRLKSLASGLGTEIESQNSLIDNMNYKIEDVDMKIGKQNKDMNKLMGKK